jgi:3-hydroxyisobutyrate dehydrogenase-like beta-hydroxyacid dehydrogenase
MHIGFIGLGQMGRGMASRLLAAGHRLVVWNRSVQASEALRASGAQVAAQVRETLDGDVVISMLADDAAVRAVWIESALARDCPPSAVHLNMATVSLAMGKALARAHREGGSAYVSAPVFGRPEFASEGQLDIVAAGPPAAIARCEPLFEALGRRWFNVGAEAHHANIVKIARNFMLATIIESLGEAFALVEKSGVPPAEFLNIITSTAMNSASHKNYGRLMLERPANPTFPLRLGLKDVELALAAGGDTHVPMPSAALIREQHLAALAHGYGDKDWAELGNWIAQCAGCERVR